MTKADLTSDQTLAIRDEIDARLKRFFGFLGIANVTAILGAFLWMYFSLPGLAAQQVDELQAVHDRSLILANQIENLQADLNESSEEFSETRSSLDVENKKFTELKNKLSGHDVDQALSIVRELKDGGLKSLKNRITRNELTNDERLDIVKFFDEGEKLTDAADFRFVAEPSCPIGNLRIAITKTKSKEEKEVALCGCVEDATYEIERGWYCVT